MKLKSGRVNVSLEKIKVAELHFGRDNNKLIMLLEERGIAIADQEFEHMHKLEK